MSAASVGPSARAPLLANSNPLPQLPGLRLLSRFTPRHHRPLRHQHHPQDLLAHSISPLATTLLVVVAVRGTAPSALLPAEFLVQYRQVRQTLVVCHRFIRNERLALVLPLVPAMFMVHAVCLGIKMVARASRFRRLSRKLRPIPRLLQEPRLSRPFLTVIEMECMYRSYLP